MRPPVTRQILLDALLTGATATSVLEALIGPPVVVRRLLPALPPHTAAAAAQLRPLPGEVIQFRRVHLIAAGIDAAEGDLWYIPARLWPGMQDALTTTDTPFGAVIAPLGPRRVTLIARLCAAGEPHGLEVAATVLSAQGQPIAYVEERFAASFPA
jgi:hypothetical protein